MFAIKKIMFTIIVLTSASRALGEAEILCFKNDGRKLSQEDFDAKSPKFKEIVSDISSYVNKSGNLTIIKPDIFLMQNKESKRCPSGGKSFEIREKHYPVVMYSSEVCGETLENNKKTGTGLAASGLVFEKDVSKSCFFLVTGEFEDVCNSLNEDQGQVSNATSRPRVGVVILNTTNSKSFWKINLFCGESFLNRSFTGEFLK